MKYEEIIDVKQTPTLLNVTLFVRYTFKASFLEVLKPYKLSYYKNIN